MKRAGVIQWQNGSFPSCKWRFDSAHPLSIKVLALALALLTGGCATTTVAPPPGPEGMPGTYYRVQRGDTLWRIAAANGLEVEDLAQINRISDTARIETGQMIFIPRRREALPPAKTSGGDDFIWPLNGRVIAAFGEPFNDMVNKGLNIEARYGNDVVASRAGKVVFLKPDFGEFGKTLIIEHSNGFSTVYARNSEVLVSLGDNVAKGQVIARVGRGARDKNPYLHFEIRKGHIAQNPYFYLP